MRQLTAVSEEGRRGQLPKHVPPDSSGFQCRPGVRLNSSLIEWLFTGQCEMPAPLQCGSGKEGVSLAFVCTAGLRARTHCWRSTSQPLRLSSALLCLEQRDHFLHPGQGRVVTLDTSPPCLSAWPAYLINASNTETDDRVSHVSGKKCI